MIFNSLEFFVFFSAFYAAYRLLPLRGQNRLLIAAGYLFYGWWDVRFLCLLAFSTALDFCCGLLLGTGKIPRGDRVRVSLFVLAAGFLFATVRWNALVQGKGDPLPTTLAGWWVMGLTAAVVAAANLGYGAVTRLPEASRARTVLIGTVAANLVFLGIFKYFNFFIDTFDRVGRAVGLEGPLARLHIILPVGISFYTFQSMSYTIDVYRGKMGPVRRFWDYALFVSFFPPLVAGPIERAAHLIPQLLRPRTVTLDGTTRGLYLVLIGLFKKVAIADGLAGSVGSVFAPGGRPSWADVVAGSVLFAFQIYCDFSGYTDIARGVAKTLGFELVHNFNLPYVSRSPAEFWQRWHISLSSWLRDYLYIPLGGNRHGSLTTYRNLMVTMALGGLWHGAAWNYVLWGVYQGLILCLYRAVPVADRPPNGSASGPIAAGRSLLAMGLFFGLTCYGWLLFRAVSFDQIVSMTRTLVAGPFDLALHVPPPRLPALVGLPLLLGYECCESLAGSGRFYRGLPAPVRGAWYAAMIFTLLMGASNEPSQFIYFQF